MQVSRGQARRAARNTARKAHQRRTEQVRAASLHDDERTQEEDNDGRFRKERPKITQQFADLKR